MRVLLASTAICLAACVQPIEDRSVKGSDGAAPTSGPVLHFPQASASDWRSGQDAVTAGRLAIVGGCLALEGSDGTSPIIWHPEARLSDDRREVVDVRTGRRARIGDAIALAGGMRARSQVSATEAQAWGLPAECTGDFVLVTGEGFHESDRD